MSLESKETLDVNEVTEEKMTRAARYYILHKEEKKAKYDSKPDVIRKRAEREQKRQEKEQADKAVKEAKALEKQRKDAIALATSKRILPVISKT
jgi:hypothetical protein